MSGIEKLFISGIRSFAPDNGQQIKFGRPLTLIVGQNGSGKTTIIECLKFITADDLPPGTGTGGAFLHDPRIDTSSKVNASIKLVFTSTTGEEMTCGRNMTVTVNKSGTRSFKRLETALLDSNGRSTSTKNDATFAKMVPSYLGVSKAVLDYVIFCHQDESLWPLNSDSATLKKKFDELFDSTKYKKVLDIIKDKQKSFEVEIKVFTNDVSHLTKEKESAQKHKTRADQLRQDIDRSKDDIKAYDKEIRILSEEINRLFKSNQYFQEVLANLKQLKHSKEITNDSINRLNASIDIMDDSDDVLRSKLNDFEKEKVLRTMGIEDLKRDIEKFKTDLDEERGKYSIALSKEGQLIAEKTEFERKVQERMHFIRRIGEMYEMCSIANKDLESDIVITRFKQELNDIKQRFEDELSRCKNQAENEINEQEKRIQSITSRKLKEEQSQQHLKKLLHDNEKETRMIQIDIDDIAVDEGKIAYAKSSLKDIEQQKDDMEKKIEDLDMKTRISEEKHYLGRLEDKIETMNSELTESNKHADIRAQYSIMTNDLSKRKLALEALVEANKDKFESVTGLIIDPETIDTQYRQSLVSHQEKVDKILAELDHHKITHSQLDMRMNLATKDLAVKKDELRSSMAEVEQVFGSGFDLAEYEASITGLESELMMATQNLEQTSFTTKYFEAAIKVAKDSTQHKCLLCERSFGDESETNSFIKLIESKTSSLPKTNEEASNNLQEVKEDLERGRSVSSSIAKIRSLENTEIPMLNKQFTEVKAEIEVLERKIQRVSLEYDSAKSIYNSVDGFRRVVSDIVGTCRDINDITEKIHDIEKKFDDDCMKGQRSSSEIHEALKRLSEQSREKQKTIDTLNEERQSNDSILGRLLSIMNEKKLAISNMRTLLEKRDSLIERVDVLRSQVRQFNGDIESSYAKMESIVPELDQATKQLTQIKMKYADQEAKVKSKLNDLYKVDTEFLSIESSIKSYELKNNNGHERLEAVQLHLVQLSGEINQHELRLEDLKEKRNTEEKTLANMSAYERNIRDNLELRKLSQDIKQFDFKIRDLERQNAESEHERYVQRSEELHDKNDRLIAEKAGKSGQVIQMIDELKGIDETLTADYADIDNRYDRTYIQLETHKAAKDDLIKSYRAIDSAIMEYHSQKMEQVNLIVDELWKRTYSGTDIDKIVIKSEKETQVKNRSYKYRVVMVKNDTELEMRGRCSAGQKVLASIIIRLALAECFSAHCGVIALDEPTTNLDSENIESLARGLAAIIEARQGQSNFQLIVITHDEQFLAAMNAHSYTDHFYMVSRNQRQKSIIEERPIHTLRR